MGVIAKYKFNQEVYANFIPEFNSEFTNYTITDETDTDGYTIRTIESDSLPTLIRFGNSSSGHESTGILSLLEIDYVNIHNGIRTLDNFLANARNLISVNTNSWDTSGINNMYCMFYNCSKLTSLDVSNFDTSKVTTMNSMFYNCSKLTSLDVSNFDTSKVTTMEAMFDNCSSLTSLDISNFNTSSVTNMSAMFQSCSSLTSLDLSNFNTSNVTSMGYMFNRCSSLTSLDISNFNTGKVTNMSYTFSYCSSLTSLDISNFNTSSVTNIEGMFNSCYKIADIGTIYCNSDTINKISSLITTNTTMWYQDANLSELTPLSNITYKEYKCVEVQQDIDSIPLTSDMFEQDVLAIGSIINGMSLQQIPTSTNGARICTKLIKVKPNTTYSCMNFGSTLGLWYLEFDKDGLYFGERKYKLNNAFQTTHSTEYVSVCVYHVDESAISPSDLDSMNLILQEVPQEIVLRGIGDVKDELDLSTGTLTQRIEEVTFDGSSDEGWAIAYANEGVNRLATITLDIVKRGSVDNYFICDKLPIKTIYSEDTNIGCCFIKHGDGTCRIVRIRTQEILNGQSLTDFRTWLSQNPITVQYVLETPIIHKVNLTNTKVIQSYATETHYETITPSDSLIPNITIPSTLNYDVAIKPSTEYTIRANTSDNLTVDLGGATGTLSNGKVTLTTPATLTHNEVKFSGTGKVKELMVVEGNEIKDNVPFFNGMKDVQMGGIKLVNIARGATCSRLVTANTNKTQFTYTSDGAANAYHTIYFDSSLLKTNTVYTVFADITTNTSDASHPIKFQFGYTSGNLLDVRKGFVGKIKQTITSANTTKDGLAIVFRPCSSGGKVVIQNPMIIEGDWTHLDEIPYIESEMIIDQPIIRSQGKNLFDINGDFHTVPFLINTNTKTVSGNTLTITGAWYFGQLLDLKPNTVYTANWHVPENTPYNRVAIYTNNMQTFVTCVLDDTKLTFTTPKTYNDISILFYASTSDETNTVSYSDIQLEEGSTATSYEPYKHQTLYSNRVIGYEEGVHYVGTTGIKVTNANYNSVMADVEGLSIAYVTNGSSNFTFWDKDGVFIPGKGQLDTALSLTDKNGFITVPTNAKYMKFASSCATGANTDYTKATVTGDLPLRSLPNGVCDTLNLVTGEYVQRVGEVVLDGKNTQFIAALKEQKGDYLKFGMQLNPVAPYIHNVCLLNDRFNSETYSTSKEGQQEQIYIHAHSSTNTELRVCILPSRLSTLDEVGFNSYLQLNPITVQYELATPIVRKLGFTTKGNYTETALNLNGWVYNDTVGKTIRFRTDSAIHNAINTSPIITNDYHVRKYGLETHGDFEYITNIDHTIYVNVDKDKLDTSDIAGFIQWLSQNPIKVGYITSTQSSDSYSNIHKPIFFNNVNVQYLPNNVDIQPQLTFQARTRNSYVMDMMKPNVTYTMKVSNYDANTRIWMANTNANTSVMPNKTLQFPDITLNDSQKQLIIVGNWYEPMIIEGDVTGKNLPYFKGILSSYHDVDEIELYSVNKNLFDINELFMQQTNKKPQIDTIGENEYKLTITTSYVESNGYDYGLVSAIPMKKGESIIFSGYGKTCVNARILKDYNYFEYSENGMVGHDFVDKENNYEYFKIARTATQDCVFCCRLWANSTLANNYSCYIKDIQITKTSSESYIPHAHNTTLIEMPTRLETVKVIRPMLEIGTINTGNGAEAEDTTNSYLRSDFIPVQPKEFVYFLNESSDRVVNLFCYDINKNFMCYLYNSNDYVPENCYFVRIFMGKTNTSDLTMTRMAYKPIQLNSLPNGVCDEIIIKPNSNKAQLVQRVGKVVLDGTENWEDVIGDNVGNYKNTIAVCTRLQYKAIHPYISKVQFNKKFNFRVGWNDAANFAFVNNSISIVLHLDKDEFTNAEHFKNWLKDNPLEFQYEITPIIHEIQLKGYPHVYENGTVTLNTDIPHQTLVSYNVNQEQLINTQNETIIRHDQQIDDLYYYIEMYLEEIYQMELFRMKLELSL